MPDRKHPTIQSGKLMFAIVWNVGGLNIMNGIPNEIKFNIVSSHTDMVGRLGQWLRAHGAKSGRQSIVHEDHASPHIWERQW
jgi:hypothetical protein